MQEVIDAIVGGVKSGYQGQIRVEWQSFTFLLQVVQDMHPEDNTLPKSYYQVKKILCLMGMEYSKIHACPNDCRLYRNEFQEMHNCPRGGLSWYKVKDDKDCNSDENSNKGPQRRFCGIFQSFQVKSPIIYAKKTKMQQSLI